MRTLQATPCLSFVIALCIGGSVWAAPYKTFKEAMSDAETKVRQNDIAAATFAATAAQGLARTPAETTEVTLLRAQIALSAGDSDDAIREYNTVFADKTVPVAKRFDAFLSLVGAKAAKDKTAISKEELDKAAADLAGEGLTPADRYAGLNNAAKAMTRQRKYDLARQFLAFGDSLVVKPETKVYRCRYMDQAPLGAGGWFLSDLIKNPANREGRFGDYDQKSAEMLFTDVTANRAAADVNAKKSTYIENTGFYMAYDKAGWHIFVLCGEPGLEDILADGRSAGSLEMYFSPAAHGETYFQWIIDQPGGKANSYDWNSPHRFFRPLKDYLKTETVTLGTNIGTYIFIPWEAVYDKLPLNGEQWPFGLIRWSPAGGVTWGGRVHEIGKWGMVEWEKPSAEQALVIRTNIARKAWGKYKGSRDAQVIRWKDALLGDPKFFDAKVLPAIERLDKEGEALKETDKLTADQVSALCDNAVPDWMEFDYLVSEMRRKYIEDELIVK